MRNWDVNNPFVSIHTVLPSKMIRILGLHKTTNRCRTYPISEIALPCAPKGLDSKDVSFFHPRGIGVLHEWDLLIPMDLVLLDIVTADVTDGRDAMGSAFKLDLVALHDFLDCGTYVAHACVNSGLLHRHH